MALTYWLSRFVQTEEVRPDAVKRHDPDLIIEKFAAQKLNDHGDVEYAVNAARMMHFRDDDSSMLETVVFTATHAHQPKVTATGPRGQLRKQRDGAGEIVMDGGVTIESDANEQFPAMKLITPKLTVIPDRHTAGSTDGVVLQSQAGQMIASSFLLNTLNRRIVFEVVKLNYGPRSK